MAIVGLEQRELGGSLRAPVLCNYETASAELPSELIGVLDPQAGSAAIVLQLLATDPTTRPVNPILMTGQTVACSRATVNVLGPWLQREDHRFSGILELNAPMRAPVAPATGE